MPILDARLLDSDPEGAELLRAILKTKRGRKAEDGFSVDANFSTATDGFPKVSRNAGVSKAVRNRAIRAEPQVGRSRRPHPTARRHLQAASGADLGHQVTVGRHRAAPSCPLAAQKPVGSKDLSQSFGFTLVQADHSGIRVEQFSEHGLGPFENHHAPVWLVACVNPITFRCLFAD